MSAVNVIEAALVGQKGFDRLEPGRLAQEGFPADLFDFVGSKEHWGSVATVAVVKADGMGRLDLKERAEAFHVLVQDLKDRAGRLVVHGALGTGAEVQLGSFGVLIFVFEQGVDAGTAAVIADLKRGSTLEKEHTVCWTVDASSDHVHRHRGFPVLMHPGWWWLKRVVRKAS